MRVRSLDAFPAQVCPRALKRCDMTIEQITHCDPFALIDTPWGEMEAWRASTIATGTMGALAQLHAIVRNDQAELEQQTAKLDAKKHQVLRTVNRLLSFMSRVDALTARVEAL